MSWDFTEDFVRPLQRALGVEHNCGPHGDDDCSRFEQVDARTRRCRDCGRIQVLRDNPADRPQGF